MNFPWRGGLLFALLFTQDPAPARPDLVARYLSILEKGSDTRRELAARALLSLGKPGCDALRRSPANPEPAKAPIADGETGPPALIRIPTAENDEALIRKLLDASVESHHDTLIRALGTRAERLLWERLDSSDPAIVTSSTRLLRELYAAPDPALMGRASAALGVELGRKRTFDMTDRSLAEFLGAESFSWILMSPRDERITIRLRDVTLRDFFRIAMPKLAAVPIGDLLILISPDRIANSEPGDTVWTPSDLAPRIEKALEALAKGDEGPIGGLTGVGVYHSLLCMSRAWEGDAYRKRASELRKQLEQRIFFIGATDDSQGKPIDAATAGTTARETLAAFEKAGGVGIEVKDKSRLDGAPPAFRFRGLPARLATRALAFRFNLIY